MKPRSHIAALFIVLTLAGCASRGTAPESTVDNLKLSVIATHQGLYLPAMQILGAAVNAGKISPQLEAQIQRASERYVHAKDAADVAIRLYGTGSGVSVQQRLSEMLAAIGELQAAQKSTGGNP